MTDCVISSLYNKRILILKILYDRKKETGNSVSFFISVIFLYYFFDGDYYSVKSGGENHIQDEFANKV